MGMAFLSNDGRGYGMMQMSSHGGRVVQLPEAEEVAQLLHRSLKGSDASDDISTIEPYELPGADLFRIIPEVRASADDNSLEHDAHERIPFGANNFGFPSDFHLQRPGARDGSLPKPLGEDVL